MPCPYKSAWSAFYVGIPNPMRSQILQPSALINQEDGNLWARNLREVSTMAKNAKKLWLPTTPKQPKPKVPESEKQLVQQKCDELIEAEFKPQYIELPPTDNDFNYRVDIYSKWYRNYFYFCSKFNCPSPRALSPSFEVKFTRLEYVKPNCFNLAYMRHTGQWWEVFHELTLQQCLDEIRTNIIFHP